VEAGRLHSNRDRARWLKGREAQQQRVCERLPGRPRSEAKHKLGVDLDGIEERLRRQLRSDELEIIPRGLGDDRIQAPRVRGSLGRKRALHQRFVKHLRISKLTDQAERGLFYAQRQFLAHRCAYFWLR
jgi:ribosomal protein S8E